MKDNIFNHVKNNTNIIDVISRETGIPIIDMKGRDTYKKSSCPICKENNSFVISIHKGIFYCFKCHATGDVIEFIARVKGISPAESVLYLMKQYNLPEYDYDTLLKLASRI